MSDEVKRPVLEVSISPHASLPKGFKNKEFEDEADFVLRLFLAFMPKEYPLDGSEKLSIHFGQCGDEGRYVRDGNVSSCFAEKFDFAAYKKAKDNEKLEQLLEGIASIIDRVAHAFRGDRRAIKEASKKVRNGEFQATVEEPELKLDSPEGVIIKLEVLRSVSRKGEDWELQIRGEKGKVISKEPIARDVAPGEGRKKFATSKWDGFNFVLMDLKGKSSYTYKTPPPA